MTERKQEESEASDRFPLADLIAVLGREIREAERRAQETGADTLQLKECSVQLGIQWEKTGEAEISVWVVKLGGSLNKQNTETITVTLEPYAPTKTTRRTPVGRRKALGH